VEKRTERRQLGRTAKGQPIDDSELEPDDDNPYRRDQFGIRDGLGVD